MKKNYLSGRRGQGPRHPTKKFKFGHDALVKIICESVTLLSTLSSWEHYVAMMHGQNHIAPNVEHLQHPAGPLLVRLCMHGMPVVTCTPGCWSTPPVVQDCLGRGSHESTDEHLNFAVHDEIANFAQSGLS